MANPLFNTFGNINPMEQLLNDARAFRSSFTGNAQAEVQKLLSTGQMSQQQFNQLSQIANQFLQTMGGRL